MELGGTNDYFGKMFFLNGDNKWILIGTILKNIWCSGEALVYITKIITFLICMVGLVLE